MTFEKKTGIPLYLQIKEHLLARIDSGAWTEGSLIPTESELCGEYGVSKITVREAIKILVMDGRLSRVRGRGTFVTKRKIEQRLNRFFSFTRWARQNGIEPASRILKVETMPCAPPVAAHLGIPEGRPAISIERLRLGNGEPLMLETIWMDAGLCPDIHLRDLANVPLNTILEREYGIVPGRALETIEPRTADPYVSRLLAIDRDVLLMLVEHTAYATDNRIIYFVTSLYRGDRVKFSIELHADEAPYR
jgi:GntR family transcriptional regulator